MRTVPYPFLFYSLDSSSDTTDEGEVVEDEVEKMIDEAMEDDGGGGELGTKRGNGILFVLF